MSQISTTTATTTTSPATNHAHLRLMDLTGVSSNESVPRLIERAFQLRASDIFLATNEQHVAVQVRYLGLVEPLGVLDRELGRRYIAHIRAEAGMDVADHRRPHDGRWIYKSSDGESTVDMRISVLPTLYGEDMSIRLLAREQTVMSLDRLGMTARQSEHFRSLLDEPGGMVLLTGPTGAGKTVSLYASLEHLRARGNVKIHTIEDPIEYAVDGLRQSEVNPAIELGTDELLRGVLRQSPDVVMIGEIRDEPTAHTAVWAANSGVTMLSTIHAGSAAGAVQSLRGFGVSGPFVAATLRGAVTQRLVRTLCPNCQEIDETDGDGRRAALLEEVAPLLSGNHRPDVLHVARGCEQCHGTGYAGRTGVFEILAVNDTIRDMILHGHSPQQIRAKAVEDGMLTLRHAALLKVAQGRTTLEELRRCVPEIPVVRDTAATAAPPSKVSVTLHNIAAQTNAPSAALH